MKTVEGRGCAGNPTAQTLSRNAGRSDNGVPVSGSAGNAGFAAAPPSTRSEVNHGGVQGQNPDASLCVSACGNGADAQHVEDAPDGCVDNAVPPPSWTHIGLAVSTPDHSKYCPGRNGCKCVPEPGSGHSGTNGRCSASASPADENWIENPEIAILTLGPCLARVWGCGTGKTGRSERCRTCLNGSDRLHQNVPGRHLPSNSFALQFTGQ